MIESIERIATSVVVLIDTGLESIENRVLPFRWEAGSEIFAELLKSQLLEQLEKSKKQIAQSVIKYPLLYLGREEVSKLKSMLIKEWNGTRNCWK